MDNSMMQPIISDQDMSQDMSQPPNPLQEKLQPISFEARNVIAQLIRKNGNSIKKAFDEYNTKSQSRLSQGSVPNAMYGEVTGLFSQITPIAENLAVLESAKKETGNDIFNNLIYDNVMEINTLLQDNVLEFPEVENLSPEQEVLEYEQAIIQLYNKMPNIQDDEKRMNLLSVADQLNQTIEVTKRNRSLGA